MNSLDLAIGEILETQGIGAAKLGEPFSNLTVQYGAPTDVILKLLNKQ